MLEDIEAMPFLSSDRQWALGFEAGHVYAKLEIGVERTEEVVHVENKEQFIVMAARFGYRVELMEWDPLPGGYLRLRFSR